MQIRPAIDIIDGKCVRLTKGDYAQKKVYNENPLEVAKAFEGAGFSHLHLVDLDGAKAQHLVNYKVLESIATNTGLSIDFGGGLKSDQDVEIAFNSGAAQITGGSIAAKNPELFNRWFSQYGSESLILGADARSGKIAVAGWLETTELNVFDFVNSYAERGISYVISTDIESDGAMQGPAFELYARMLQQNPTLKVIASGGVTTLEDVIKLDEMGCSGAIIGKALYEGTINLVELGKRFSNAQNAC